LTIVNNNAGNGDTGLAALIKTKRVRKILCSFPRQADSWHFDAQYRSGEIELELVPKARSPSASAPPAQALAPSTRPRPTARGSPKGRKRGASAAATMCSSIRSTPTTR